MRFPFAAALLAVSASAFAQYPAFADEIEPATLDRVVEIATSGYARPDVAVVGEVHKSRARNGLGYCGTVSVESGDGVTAFHVLLETAGGPSVLRLADYPEGDTSANAVAVRQLLKNFGCTD